MHKTHKIQFNNIKVGMQRERDNNWAKSNKGKNQNNQQMEYYCIW